jgi:hypothetical protein
MKSDKLCRDCNSCDNCFYCSHLLKIFESKLIPIGITVISVLSIFHPTTNVSQFEIQHEIKLHDSVYALLVKVSIL